MNLAKKVAKSRGFVVEGDEGAPGDVGDISESETAGEGENGALRAKVEFRVEDFLGEQTVERLGSNHWDLVLDKGTFDAIALMSIDVKDGEEEVNGRVHETERGTCDCQ